MTSSAPKQETPRTDAMILSMKPGDELGAILDACELCRRLERELNALSASRQGEPSKLETVADADAVATQIERWLVACGGDMPIVRKAAHECRSLIRDAFLASRSSAPAEQAPYKWTGDERTHESAESAPEELVKRLEVVADADKVATEAERWFAAVAADSSLAAKASHECRWLIRNALLSRPAADREDARRLDWLETQQCWIGLEGEYEIRPTRVAGKGYKQTVRAAIDAALSSERGDNS